MGIDISRVTRTRSGVPVLDVHRRKESLPTTKNIIADVRGYGWLLYGDGGEYNSLLGHGLDLIENPVIKEGWVVFDNFGRISTSYVYATKEEAIERVPNTMRDGGAARKITWDE